ncbi:MAG TPA: MGMT family protein [Candidatus Thioglobus sp.]|nr:MGMT family protein [Candidatus Thioglobus sp.]HIL43301.1 MGMT family protein [Gammaproteobacteria bacterium]
MTEFQNKCYSYLKNNVPQGKVTTYSQLAKLIGHPNAYRAVGSAMNKNPFAPEVPCHRVVKSNGEIGGFADDLRIKIELLKSEGVETIDGKITNFKKCLYIP